MAKFMAKPMVQSHKNLTNFVLELPRRNKPKYLNVLMENGSVKSYSSQDYFDQIRQLAKALTLAELKRGDKVGLFANTRHEWSVCDLAITCVGAVVVPIYPNITTDDLAYILNHSECKILFVENRTLLKHVLVIRDQLPHLKTIVVFDPPPQVENGVWRSLDEFVAVLPPQNEEVFDFEQLCKGVRANDPVTIIYTSGTTGQPKGVVLTHTQVISEILETFAAMQITSGDHTLSFLPYSHVLGRTEHWGNLIVGYSMTYSAGMERLLEEFRLVNPTAIVAVPRILEKIYTNLKTKIQTSNLESSIFEWAIKVGSRMNEFKDKEQKPDMRTEAEFLLAKHVFCQRIQRNIFGTHLRFVVCGGAPLSSEIMRFFQCCGILVLEGYGLTETTGAICVNRPYDFEFGTVGKPLYRTKIKLAPDGEILLAGPTVMTEYYKESEATVEVLVDGWLHTGDIGEITDGRLVIKDRKKDLIKTANGKYVAPQKIEGLFKQLPYISHAHIHGDQKSFVVALLTVDKSYLFSEARERGIEFKSLDDLKEQPLIKEMIRTGVAQINLNLASHESIKNYAVLSEDFSVESGEITPSMKIKRKAIDAKYKDLIDSLYDKIY